jgi:DNA topoisomerase 2-associated protein PAT1
MLVELILKSSHADDTRFDASQYAFFGNNVLEEVELGGLEEDNVSDAAFIGLNNVERPLSSQGNVLEVVLFRTLEI